MEVARGTCCEVGGKSHVKEVSTGGDGSPHVVEQVACIHWWPCNGLGVPTYRGYHWWRSKRSLLSFFKATIVYVCMCVCVCVYVCVCACSIGTFLEDLFLCKLLVDRWEALHKWQ